MSISTIQRVCRRCGITAEQASRENESICSDHGLVAGHSYEDRPEDTLGQWEDDGGAVPGNEDYYATGCLLCDCEGNIVAEYPTDDEASRAAVSMNTIGRADAPSWSRKS